MSIDRAVRNLRLPLAGLLSAMALAFPATGLAATFTVDKTSDDPAAAGTCTAAADDCSLRQAIDLANNAAGADSIDFSVPSGSTIALTDGPLATDDELTIAGPGAEKLTITRASSAPAFEILDVFGPTTTVSGLAISGGSAGPFQAAGVNLVGGDATLDGLWIKGNTGDGGGSGSGGGSAGAIANFGSSLTVRNSTISDNHVVGADTGQSGTIITGTSLTLVNTTISGNTVSGSGTPDDGGAVTILGGTVDSFSSTIANNSSEGGVGGIGGGSGGSDASLANTVIAANTGDAAPDCGPGTGSRGYNLIGDGTGCAVVAATGDRVGTGASPVAPGLGDLGDHGGPTPTRNPVAGSPLIDAGNPAASSDAAPPAAPAPVPCPTTDQRGVGRPAGGACDIGAVEVVPPTAVTAAASDVSLTGATLNGSVNPQLEATTYRFEYGTDTGYGSVVPASDAAVGSDGTSHAVSQAISGLTPSTTYHFRVVATNSAGTRRGADETFTTGDAPPSATTGGVTGVGKRIATVTGTVDSNKVATTFHFEYGKTLAYGKSTPDGAVGADETALGVSAALRGLSPNTTYHYRLVVASAAGTDAGADQVFKTKKLAPPRVVIGHRNTRVRAGRTLVRLRCVGDAGTRCKGTLRLAATRLRARSAAAAPRASFSIAAGKSKSVRIQVPPASRLQLAKRGKAVARATATLAGGRSKTRLITLIQG
jgi:hypothetical protein